MKKLVTLMLGMGLVFSSASFADDKKEHKDKKEQKEKKKEEKKG